jgi:Major Facilitator Superfamily
MKRQVIASRNVRVLLVGQTVNMFGNTAMTIVLGIWVKNLTGSSGAAGLIFMLIAATAFLAPVTGTLVDRFPRRPLLIVNDTLTGAVIALLLLVHDRNELWLIYVVTGLYGISGQIYRAARGGLLHSLVSDELLGDVNGLISSLGQGLKVAGPLVGAGMYAAWGGHVVVLADVATFAFSVASYIALRQVPRVVSQPRQRDRGGRALMAGLRQVTGDPVIRRIMLVSAVAFTGAGMIDVAMFSLVTQGLHRPAALLGVLTAIEGAGSVLAGLVIGAVIRRAGEYSAACAGFLLNAVGLAAASTATVPGAVAGSVLIGFGLPLALVAELTVVQRRTPAALQGRAIAASEAIVNTPFAIAIAVGAAMIAATGFQPVYLGAAVGFGGAGLVLLPYLGATRPATGPSEVLAGTGPATARPS